MNLKVITLEDNIEYFILNEKDNYVYLVNVNDAKDFCIRKIVKIDAEDFLEPLSSNEEFDKALLLFDEI